MAQEKVTYSEKTNPIPVVSRKIQATAEDFNELKSIMNNNATDAENRISNLEENQTTGDIVFETYALMVAQSTPEENVSYKVANDPDTALIEPPNSNNGYYHWNGTGYIKDADLNQDIIDDVEELKEDTATGIKKELDSIIEKAYIDTSGVLVTDFENYNVKVYPVITGEQVVISGYSVGDVAEYAYYADAECQNLIAIGGINPGGENKITRKSTVPSSANYIALTARLQKEIYSYDWSAVQQVIEELQQYVNIYTNKEVVTNAISDSYIESDGTITTGVSGFTVKVYDIDGFDKIRLAGVYNGNVTQFAFYKEPTCDTLVSKGVFSNWENEKVDRLLDYGARYIAVSDKVSDNEDIDIYSLSETISDYIYTLGDRVKAIENDIDIYATEKTEDNILDDSYIFSDGSIVSNFPGYRVKVYSVDDFEKIRVSGVITGSVMTYAFYSDLECTTLVQAGPSGSFSSQKIDSTIDVAAAYIGITERTSGSEVMNVFDNEKNISEVIYEIIDRLNEAEGESLTIAGFGDSLTAGAGGNGTTYLTELKELLGDEYSVSNLGVGGENSLAIGTRHGGIPGITENDFTLPSDTSDVQIGNDAASGIISAWDDSYIKLLQQGANGVNPVVVDGVECTLKYTGGIYYLSRNTAGDARYVYAGTQIFCNATLKYSDVHCQCIYVGTNGSWSLDPQELISQIKAMIEFSQSDRFIIMGIHYRVGANFQELEREMLKAFGNRYLNIRTYMIGNALEDAGITPTAQDLIDISNGYPPDSLRSDSIHFNPTGYELVGNQVYEIGKNLGYW